MAQNKSVPTEVGYVDSDLLLQAHPGFSKVKEIQGQAQAELNPLREQLQSLEAKSRAGNLSAKEQQDFQSLSKAYQDTLNRWQDKEDAVLGPITDQVNQAIAKTAQEQGFALVLDKRVAGTSGLVVYADASLDLTDAVVKAMPK
ncbi:hypothetical protein MGR01S_13670 [Meiothermus granaticius NBRC 107808]|uniref:Outer membrane protein (OmpH-like) n=2 Tax=Meiothermus TaxID=65551 RepID=A0A399FB26_9DEIN|nr:Outer membrane protein (OmpH-like) [Meiothermus granaticius NBRC 107808]GEM86742.1 hypothetical protein MGR01S_13670 [Meiothermus granaticius NBRC 107808]